MARGKKPVDAESSLDKNPVGRPTLYKPEYCEQARKLCLLGSTDKELADFFNVSFDTIQEWKKVYPEFSYSIREGKEVADANVADRLYQRAMGYEHKAVKIVADAKTGMDHTVEYVERYAPDTAAGIFWLKNRQKTKWRDKTEQDVQATIDARVEADVNLSPSEAYLRMLGK